MDGTVQTPRNLIKVRILYETSWFFFFYPENFCKNTKSFLNTDSHHPRPRSDGPKGRSVTIGENESDRKNNFLHEGANVFRLNLNCHESVVTHPHPVSEDSVCRTET